jgi:hypothetical protein
MGTLKHIGGPLCGFWAGSHRFSDVSFHGMISVCMAAANAKIAACSQSCMHARMVGPQDLPWHVTGKPWSKLWPPPIQTSCHAQSFPPPLPHWRYERERYTAFSLSLSMLVCLCVCTLYRHAEVRPGQNTAAQGKVKSISILWLYISMQHFNISECQSAGSQTVPGYRVHASMALYAQVLLAWLPSWDVCLCVWHICFKKVSQIKEMCHKLKKKWVHVSSRIDGCIDHHTHIRTHLEQFSRKDMPLLSFSAFTNWNPYLFVSTCTYMCAGLLGCCVCVFCWQ